MKIKSLLFTSFIIMAMVLTGCSTSTDPAPTATTAENNNTNTDSTNNNNNSKTGKIKLTCGNDAVYSGEDSVLEVSFENFESNPEKIDVYSEASTSPLLSGAAVNSGKITITAPANYAKNKIAYYVKSGSTESNHLSLNYYNSVSVSNFESFINSITSTDIVNIRVTGNYEDFKTKTELLKNENLKINLDISQLTNVEIGENAFYACTSLVCIKLPENITSIGDSSFYCCKNLAEIKLPNKLTTIGKKAFSGNALGNNGTKLTSIELPASLLTIGDKAFFACKELINVKLQNGITTIGAGAFVSCEKLKNINLPDSITSIGDGSFANCYALNIITLPSGITGIPGYAFEECKNLTTVIIPNGITSIYELAFYGCKKLESISIPTSVNEIGYAAFLECTNLGNVTFVNKTGWKVTNTQTSEVTNISDNDLADTAKAALYLRETYKNETWTRTNQ